ncbi:short chain enoyl-CoA hydratase [Desulfatibacillum alkenivorans DSM 16219]|jgi:enoyl-CoA hydratase|uniref:Short chain enoyl-CoA hydratase n=1 Tax=Desulfatibacillum alkenivorans DSM 16219 TaxID=1121393 RepID=A0A1M6HF94_9BACT|nr:enoyl-CoA hydratase [Desulfatibacillum alkenivorans]SHJ20865.1 short chain enoyl-CoA hydratase [Desulfatibacillum alkenivorans DSM 16219]
MDKPVLFRKEDGVAILTLNRPEKRNALNQDLLTHLYGHLDEVKSDDSIRVAVITGAGSSFSAGLDLNCIATDNMMDPRGDGVYLTDFMKSCNKPFIGAINGPAITGAFEIALNCDFLIAVPQALFRDTHALLGIYPGWGMSQLLSRAVGIRMARQISFTGKDITARQALNLGLVNEIVEPDQLMPRVMEIARDICKTKADFLPGYRKLINDGHNLTAGHALDLEKQVFTRFLNGSAALI